MAPKRFIVANGFVAEPSPPDLRLFWRTHHGPSRPSFYHVITWPTRQKRLAKVLQPIVANLDLGCARVERLSRSRTVVDTPHHTHTPHSVAAFARTER
jgi:hypothetical protein